MSGMQTGKCCDRRLSSAAYLAWIADMLRHSAWFDFVWGDPKGRVLSRTLTKRAAGVRSIELGLPDKGILNLAGMAASPLAAVSSGEPSALVEISMSSIYAQSLHGRQPEEYLRWAAGAWFRPGDDPPRELLHTRADKHPWIRVTFPSAQPLKSLCVRNRPDSWGVRAGRLRIHVTYDDGFTEELADCGQLLDAVRTATSPGAHAGPFMHEHECWRLWTELWQYLTTARPPSEATAWISVFRRLRHALAPDVEASFVDHFNDIVLSRTGRIMGQHGLHRPFALRPPAEVLDVLKGATELAADLRQHGYAACLGFGTALGYARHASVIPHDDDVDLLALHEHCSCVDRNACMAHMAEVLGTSGYRVSGEHTGHRWVGKKNVYDVFVGMPAEMDRLSFQVGCKQFTHPRDMIFPAIELTLRDGVPAPFPRNIGAYVQDVYGADWRIPNPHFVH